MSLLLMIVVIVLLIGILPSWPHSKNWGYGPSSLVGVVAVVLLILILTGNLNLR